MTFNDNSNIGNGGVGRSSGGRRGVVVGGSSLLGLVAVVLVSQLFGVDVGGLLGGQATAGSSVQSDGVPLTECKTGADANASTDCLVVGAYKSLDYYWGDEAGKLGLTYRSPHVDLFTQSVGTGCGSATSAVGPFYCPSDERIYLDTSFYEDLRSTYGATGGPLAQLYVVAHEWGHHIQKLQGTVSSQQGSASGAASTSVRTELQADCYAGAWVGAAATTRDESGTTLLEPVTKAQLADALNAAAAIGDDRLQRGAGAPVNSESWTHGSSEQRQKWFSSGYGGGPASCDTFAVSDQSL